MDIQTAFFTLCLEVLKEFLKMYRRQSPSRSIEYNFSFAEYTPETQQFIHQVIQHAHNRSQTTDNLRFTFDDSPRTSERSDSPRMRDRSDSPRMRDRSDSPPRMGETSDSPRMGETFIKRRNGF
ncbi:hypothetical protein TNIN_274521 [Trichonephila inaurata madagascariensis]|uniref:Uncharacterized protein n=1 Tax=Trichonephila inaurata madagascariensis TaxID=2747483 RepID=A0A8X6YSV5_9ARAC|nr:hypothetical protein TNIN_274521 [Trichonephila inaurata madagascariensis]